MCGIIGYVGKREAYPILIDGLKRLEYRGYDSAGIALVNASQKLSVHKTKGKVGQLEAYCAERDTTGTIGIAHTRWATHGKPDHINAHPHCSASGRLALIHNGIIENYAVIKEKLRQKGVSFKSETDSEVLVQLIEYIMQSNGLEVLEALQAALQQVIGAYAIVILDREHPDTLICARKSSPLVIGLGSDGDYHIASDALPIAAYTSQVVYLDDNDIAILRYGQPLQVVNIQNEAQHPKIKQIDRTLGDISKGDYPFFMLKEIFEQPDCLRDCMRGRVLPDDDTISLSAVADYRKQLTEASRILIVACGTSWHAGLIGKQLIERFCRIPVEVEYASEFRYRDPVILPGDVVIAISQSGETADTLAAAELARSKGALVFGICNAVGSSISRQTHTGIYIHVGPEIGVASTKAFTGQVTVLSMLALCLAHERQTISEAAYHELVGELRRIPAKMEEALQTNELIRQLAPVFTYARNCLYLGRGYNYPVALEGALKLKEISYIHAEGYPAAEMKHGPIALIDSEMPVFVIATRETQLDKLRSNIQEVKARGGRITALTTAGDNSICRYADHVIGLPDTHECFQPLIASVPLQLLAYHIAVSKGLDVDYPRNLAKSVTVE